MMSEDTFLSLYYDGERKKETIALCGRHDGSVRTVEAQHETAKPIVVQRAEKMITTMHGDCALMVLCAALVPLTPVTTVAIIIVVVVGGCAPPPLAR